MSVEDVVTRMFSTDYKKYDYFTKTKPWEYNPDIIGGIEIETCVQDPDQHDLDFYYEETKDSSIKCEEGKRSVEYVTPEPYSIVDILDPETEIGSNTEDIFKHTYPCERTISGRVSCGTHVHMSNIRLSMLKYPHFDKVMRFFWIQYYQPYCIHRFYKYQDRDTNEDYTKISTHLRMGKYEMFNVEPSYANLSEDEGERLFALSRDPERTWHFEFRGYGEMRSGWTKENPIAKEYMQVLMNLWYEAEDYYNKHNIANADRVKIIPYKRGFPNSQLPILYTIRRLLNPNIEKSIEAIRLFDRPHDKYYKLKQENMVTTEYMNPNKYFGRIKAHNIKERNYFLLYLTHQLPDLDFKVYDLESLGPCAKYIQVIQADEGVVKFLYGNITLDLVLDLVDKITDLAMEIESIIQDDYTDIDILWKIVQRDTREYQLHFGYSRFGYARRPRNKKRKRRLKLKF